MKHKWLLEALKGTSLRARRHAKPRAKAIAEKNVRLPGRLPDAPRKRKFKRVQEHHGGGPDFVPCKFVRG